MKQDQIYGIRRDRNMPTGSILIVQLFYIIFILSKFCWYLYFRVQKESQISEIAKELNIPSAEVKAKFHILRSQFNRECNKERTTKSGAGSDEAFVSKWEFKSSLQFLKVGTVAGNSVSNLVWKKLNDFNGIVDFNFSE